MSASVINGSISEIVPTSVVLPTAYPPATTIFIDTGSPVADEVAPYGPGTVGAIGGTNSDRTDALQQTFEQPHVAVLGRVRRSDARAPCGRRRGRRRGTRATPTGVPRRAEISATDIGVWHSSTMRRSSGVALRPSWSSVISASTGAWSSNTPSDELVRPRVSMYGRDQVAVPCVFAAGSWARLGRRHRIADLGSAVWSSEMRPGVSALAHFSTRTAIS